MIVEAEEKINIVQLLNCDIIISTADRGHTPHSTPGIVSDIALILFCPRPGHHIHF